MEPVEVTDLVTDLQHLAARLDPDAIADADVGGVVADLGQAKRLVDGMVTAMARRTDTVTLAKATGTTQSQARQRHRTSTRLTDQPEVADAVRQGALSEAQVDAIADAVTAAPEAAGSLVTAASQQSAEDLRRTCRDTRANADPDPEATRQLHWRRRTCRSWRESDGEWKTFISGPADFGARFDAALRAAHDHRFRAARAEGRREDDGAYRFDALFDVLAAAGTTPGVDGDQAGDATTDGEAPASPPTGSGRGRQQKVIVTVDAAALRRGHALAGETCDIAGVGRVPVSAVLPLIPDAELAVVIRDGVDVANVTHLSRQATAHQRTALEARGYECEVPTCRSSHLLEIDHVAPWAETHRTVLDQLAWLCSAHHREKTRGGYRLTGPPGRRRWLDPDGRTIATDPDNRRRGHDDLTPQPDGCGRRQLTIDATLHRGIDAAVQTRRRLLALHGWRTTAGHDP